MKAFTVVEMIIVLLIICVVLALSLPNIKQKKEIINEKGCKALLEVVNSQILLYELENEEDVMDINDLVKEGYIKQEQTKCQNGKEIIIEDGQAKTKD